MRPRWPWLVVMPLAVSVTVVAAAWNTKGGAPADASAVLGPAPTPVGNPPTLEKVALGKLLFFDPRLSGSDTIACATCHRAGGSPTAGLPRSLGAGGEMPRNAMTLWNVAYMHLIHSDGGRASLEEQADKAIPGPAMAQPYPALLAELGAVPEYRARFRRVFPEGITEANI